MKQTCSVGGCENHGQLNKDGSRTFVKGLCVAHYKRNYRHGHLLLLKAANGGRVRHSLWTTYSRMKQRCYDRNDRSYKNYGQRGIRVCARWLGVSGFDNFIADMGEKPSSKHSIDRLRVDGAYSPNNCRWATAHQQAANTRVNNETVGVRSDRKSGKFEAYIEVDKKRYRRYFDDIEDAKDWRKRQEERHAITY